MIGSSFVSQSLIELSCLKPNEWGEIIHLQGIDKAYRYKLMVMGLTLGTIFQVIQVAPLGDPLLVEVRGSLLSLRKDEVKGAMVRKIIREA